MLRPNDRDSLNPRPNVQDRLVRGMMFLVEPSGRRHGRLDSQASHVLPSLLQQRHEVVDGKHDIGNELLLCHANISDSDTHAEHLLELELDGRLDFGDLRAQVIRVGDGSWEFASWTYAC
jgi:hypothetical protein